MLGDALRRPTWVSLAAGVVPVAMHFYVFVFMERTATKWTFLRYVSEIEKVCRFFILVAAMRPQFNAFLRPGRAKQRRMAGTH